MTRTRESGNDVEGFLHRFMVWVSRRDDVRAAGLVGSHARRAAGPRSDVDLVLLTIDPARYVTDVFWVEELGVPMRWQRESRGAVTSIRVFFDSGLEVEFGVTTPDWASLDPIDEGTRRVVEGGLRVLLDRDEALARLRARMSDSS